MSTIIPDCRSYKF